MKRLGLTPHLVSATLFLSLIGTAKAEEARTPPANSASLASKRDADLLRRFDSNGDGKLDDDERAVAKETRMKEQMNLQMSRAASVPGGPEAFRVRMLELFDTNKDGRLDDEERAAAQKFAREHGFGADGEMRDELIKRFDQNGNGKIDEEERPALEAFVKERIARGSATAGSSDLETVIRAAIQANAAQRLRFDQDGNGKLDDAEWQAARQEIQRVLFASGTGGTKVEEEKRRLEAVAAEVARRRRVREEAAKGLAK